MSKKYCLFCGVALSDTNRNSCEPFRPNKWCCNDCNSNIIIPLRFQCMMTNKVIKEKNRS